jgi:hypothetical protein
MTNIQHVAGQSRAVAQRFVTEVPGFAGSDEYRRLDQEEREKPGFVFSALGRFTQFASTDALEVATSIIEDSAATDDQELHNYLVTEVFEQWDDTETGTRARLRLALGPNGRRLYDRWMNIVVPKA